MNRMLEFGRLGIGLPELEPAASALVGKFSGQRALVIGSAACVWDDLDRLGVRGDLNNGWHTVCVNDVIQHYPGVVNHGFSYQYRWLKHWVGGRRETICSHKVSEKWGGVGLTHSRVGAQVNWPWPGNGTSSLGAVYTAIALGYDPIVLCGVPLDDGPHYFEPPWATCNFTNEVGNRVDGKMVHWQTSLSIFKGRVKSQSGRTRDLLGAP